MDLLYEVLRAWGMNQQGARLVSLPTFRDRVIRLVMSDAFSPFEDASAADITEKWERRLDALWERLVGPNRIMASNSVVVGSSKLLHHLLPDVIPPIDRAYTWSFLRSLDPTDAASARYRVPAGQGLVREYQVFRNAIMLAGHVSRGKKNLGRSCKPKADVRFDSEVDR